MDGASGRGNLDGGDSHSGGFGVDDGRDRGTDSGVGDGETLKEAVVKRK